MSRVFSRSQSSKISTGAWPPSSIVIRVMLSAARRVRCLPTPVEPVKLIDRKSTRLNSSHTVIYTLSLHDALPIYQHRRMAAQLHRDPGHAVGREAHQMLADAGRAGEADRSEEHTSELQSHRDLHSFPTRRSSDLSAPAHGRPAPS